MYMYVCTYLMLMLSSLYMRGSEFAFWEPARLYDFYLPSFCSYALTGFSSSPL